MGKLPRLILCDLDNTLYDWFSYFVPSFYAMIDKAVEITHCDRQKLLDDMREIHQREGDSEHPFALLETPTVKTTFPDLSPFQIARELDPCFHAFNVERKKRLKLHPGVFEGLSAIRDADIKLVAHTESRLYGVVDRLRRLEITSFFHKIYCRERPRHTRPNGLVSRSWLSGFPMEKVVELSRHQAKPDVDVLLEICAREGASPGETAYVGDSVARDILMAKRAGVFAIWAAYGARHDDEQYKRLVRISHWTHEDVQREAQLRVEAGTIKPDLTCENMFSDFLEPLKLRERCCRA